jgi:hypothetical protein
LIGIEKGQIMEWLEILENIGLFIVGSWVGVFITAIFSATGDNDQQKGKKND